MNALSTLVHNGSLVRQAEKMLNSMIDSNTEDHQIYLYIENPDGTTIRLQPGFKIKDYELIGVKL